MINQKNSYPNELRRISHRSSLFYIKTPELSQRLSCLICGEIMIEPTQTECGCRFCKCCIETYKSQNDVCPICKESNGVNGRLIPDKAVEKEILHLMMKCINGCSVNSFPLKELAEHLEICEFRSEQCELCSQSYISSKKDKHIRDDCIKTIIACEYCGEKFTREYLKNEHLNYQNNLLNICEKFTTVCPFKCSEEKLIILKEHLNICSKKPSKCPLVTIGCSEKSISCSDLNTHMKDKIVDHYQLLMLEVQYLISENESIKLQSRKMEEELSIEIQHLKDSNFDLTLQLEKLTENVEKMEKNIENLTSELHKYRSPSIDTISNNYNGNVTWNVVNIREKIKAAKCGGPVFIVSDSFYVTRPGYRMALKIYPNGDGRAVNEFLSVFFLIYKGDYDNSLRWPFQSRVSIVLLSDNHLTADIAVRMKPDNNVACYGKPLTDYNLAAGQPSFVSQSILMTDNSYVVNGAISLRLSVQPTN